MATGGTPEVSSQRSSKRHRYLDFSRWHLDIDSYLNPYLPHPPWRYLPRRVTHFFGYRGEEPPKALGNLVIAFWSLIGVFCGVLVVAEVSLHVPEFQKHHAPTIVGSFGAAAVLEFCAVESPFSQPRNAFFSQLIASVIGVGIAKLFALNPSAHSKPEIGGALACAIATFVMVLTNTVHPPAGATALLAVTQMYEVGWWLVPIMLLGVSLMLAVALLINNIQRRFPVYWWTPHPYWKPPESDVEVGAGQKENYTSSSDMRLSEPMQVIIHEGRVLVPDNLWVFADEREVLEKIAKRMQQ